MQPTGGDNYSRQTRVNRIYEGRLCRANSGFPNRFRRGDTSPARHFDFTFSDELVVPGMRGQAPTLVAPSAERTQSVPSSCHSAAKAENSITFLTFARSPVTRSKIIRNYTNGPRSEQIGRSDPATPLALLSRKQIPRNFGFHSRCVGIRKTLYAATRLLFTCRTNKNRCFSTPICGRRTWPHVRIRENIITILR